jgi:adenylate cyclase
LEKRQPLIAALVAPTVRGNAQRAALAAAAAAITALCVWLVPAVQVVEQRSRDALTPAVSGAGQVPQVVVIDISEESLKSLGMWPWSRGRLAELVEELAGPLGARGVALDMVLPEAADAAGDARLASLAANVPLTLAQVFDFSERRASIKVGVPAGGSAPGPQAAHLVSAQGYVANHAGLARARCAGHIGIRPDADGVLRRVHLRAQLAGQVYSTLALALMECVQPGVSPRIIAALDAGPEELWRVPFRVPVSRFLTLPAEAVIGQQVDAALVRGRYVLIGSSAVGLSDYVATPAQAVTAGVLVHAQVLAELLEAAAKPEPGWLHRSSELSLAALLGGVALLALALRAGVAWGLVALAVLVACWLAACATAFGAGHALAVLPPATGFIAFTVAWLGVEFADTRRVSQRMLTTLSHYVAEPVLKLLVKQGLERTLAPSRQEITVLVADMAGYTRLTAESSLEQSARLTTEFLEAITGPVLNSGATLDRYTGDGLIAFWGAPLARRDHAQCAFDASLQMLDALHLLNARRRERGETQLSMRIGLESGEALVGDLGSSSRSVYTAVGTCINLASRLQEIARDLGQVLVVGPHARASISAGLRSLGRMPVRGMTEPIELFMLAEPVGA